MRDRCNRDKATNDKRDSKRERQRKNHGQNPANKSHDTPSVHPFGCFLNRWHNRLEIQIPVLHFELVTRMEKDANCRESENHRENNAAITIDFLGRCRSLVVMQDCRHQHLDQAKENK